MDSRLLYGVEHVEFALEQAGKAFERGSNISSDPFVEVLVRASGQRQIKRAIDMFGLHGSREIVLLGPEMPEGLLESIGAVESEIRLDNERLQRLKEAYSITDAEIGAVSDSPAEAVKDLIKERIALVSVL
ncbi:MAG: hypothetical protein D6733_07765 [Methanobacteriota archaeon]|nr:MAG: hypothetical protein D6733_07765 [Euryarchaeota archaeon]